MIVEFFGPPGAGKTTLARALLRRLQERGYATEIALTLRPLKSSLVDPGGFGHALGRMVQAIVDIVTMALHPISHKAPFSIAAGLIQILPPKNLVWFIRVSQYILRLSNIWHRTSSTNPIVIYDQAFIQAVCSLAVFNRSIDDAAFLRALQLIPRSDMAIHVKIGKDEQRSRLRNRLRNEPMMARLLEASQTTNLQFSPVIERASAVLEQRGQPVVVVQFEDLSSIDRVVDEIEQEIVARLSNHPVAPRREVSDTAQDGEKILVCESGIQSAPFPLLPMGSSPQPSPATDRLIGKKDRFAQASIWALLTYVGGAGLTCAVQFVIARMLRAEGYGIYSYVWAWVSLLSYGATLGFIAFVLRFASAYRASEQWSLMYGSIRFAVSRSLAAALAASGIGLLIVWLRWDHLEPKFAASMAIGIATIPLITLHLVGSSIVRVFGGFIAAILPERVFRDGLLLVIIGLTVWGSLWPLDARVVLVGSFISSAATLAFVAYAVFRRWPEQIRKIQPAYLPHEWWIFAFPVMIMMGLEIVMTRTGVLVLGWSGKIAEAGLFALAFNLAMLVQLSRVAVSLYFSPMASELHARGDLAELQNLFARATLMSLAGAAVLAVPVLVLTAPLLRLFGSDFTHATSIAQTLVIGQFLAAAAGPQQNLLMMTGHERSAAAIMLAFAALTIVGCEIAIIQYGAIGAAVVTSATLLAWNVTMAIHIERCLGIRPGLVLAFTKLWTRRHETIVPAKSSKLPTQQA